MYIVLIQTADMGITENATEGDTRIELWFRRQKSRETLLLQAETTCVKEAWTNEITKLLWDQGGLSKGELNISCSLCERGEKPWVVPSP